MITSKKRKLAFYPGAIPAAILAICLFFTAFNLASAATITGVSATFSDVSLHPNGGGRPVSSSSVSGSGTVSGNTAVITLTGLTPGTYSKVHTKISSITLSGMYGTTKFSYTSTGNLNKNVNLDQPVTIGENGTLTLVLDVDAGSIFMNNGTELDPNDPANKNIIDRNIRSAFRDAFRMNR